VLAAPSTDPDAVQYAMDWVHYLNDPPATDLGRLRAANGHAEPYGVRCIREAPVARALRRRR
jgi:alpha-L-arabinofuranosidase